MQQIQTQKGYKKEKFLFGFQEIPESWTIKKLIELCNEKPQYGAALSALPKNTDLPRYIRITDLNDDGSLKADEWKSISEKDSKPYLLAEDEILFARTGATVGKTYLYNKKHGKCAFAGYLIRFKPEKNKLNPEYLFHYTHSSYYWKWLRSIQTEGVQPNVNAEQYSNMLLLCPPIQEQQKIASILSTVDELILKIEQIIEQTQRLKKGLMQRLLTKGISHTKFKKTELGEIPETWSIQKLINLCMDKPQYGAGLSAIPKNIKLPRYIRITDLNDDGSLREDEWKSLNEKDSKPYLLSDGEILFARTGATVGKTYLYQKEHGVCAFAGYLIRFIPDKVKLNPEFLFHYTHSSIYWKWLKSIQTEGVQPNVNAEQYSNMILLTPPIKEQQKIASIISNLDKSIEKQKINKEYIENLKKGLMQQLLTGKIRVKI